MSRSGASLMSGVPELLLLRLLSRGEMYGYQLARSIRVMSQETIDVGESVLYPALHSLEQRKLLRSVRRSVDGRTRVYYRITPAGQRRLAALTEDWRRISTAVDSALQERSYG